MTPGTTASPREATNPRQRPRASRVSPGGQPQRQATHLGLVALGGPARVHSATRRASSDASAPGGLHRAPHASRGRWRGPLATVARRARHHWAAGSSRGCVRVLQAQPRRSSSARATPRATGMCLLLNSALGSARGQGAQARACCVTAPTSPISPERRLWKDCPPPPWHWNALGLGGAASRGWPPWLVAQLWLLVLRGAAEQVLGRHRRVRHPFGTASSHGPCAAARPGSALREGRRIGGPDPGPGSENPEMEVQGRSDSRGQFCNPQLPVRAAPPAPERAAALCKPSW